LRNDLLKDLGEIHLGRKRCQPRSVELRAFFAKAREHLQHPVLEFGADDVTAIADGFKNVILSSKYTCYACAIMPDHVHVLIREHGDSAETMVANLHRESHLRLRELGLRDMEHPVWGGKGWKVYLEDADGLRRTVKYIDDNPIKIRQPRQRWSFVTPYDGWVGARVRVVKPPDGRNHSS
jgi:REP element-mobilizing transposase RayT